MSEDNLRSAMERLNEQNRLLLEARMLPRNRALTADQTFAIIDRFGQHISHRGISLAQVAREVNYAASVISQWQGNTYRGDMEAVTRAINDWLERDARRAEAAKPKDYVKTWVAETMRTICHQADKRLMMAVIVAPAGSGKSKVLQAVCEETRGIYLVMDQTVTSRQFLQNLAITLGRKGECHSAAGSLMRFIVDTLKGTKRPIFIDEAHQLTKAISHVRSIHDQAGVPIVMAGTVDILKLVEDRIDGRGQFASRTIVCNLIDDVCNAEAPDGGAAGRDLFTLDEIRAFFDSRKIRLATDALRLMWAVACLPNHGTLRLIGFLADMARDANPSADVLERGHVLEAMALLMGSRRARHVKAMADRHDGAQRKTMVA